MTNRLTKGLATCAALALTLGLAACTSNSQSGTQSGSQSGTAQSGDAVPTVDRSGKGDFPAVTGDAGAAPKIAAGTGTESTTILAKTLTKGSGAEVGLDDAVLANYAGALWNGTVFDSSFTNGKPVAFSLNAVIKGWKYGLATQHIGDRVELVIPATYGYGSTAQGTIPANSTLVFVVDIIDSFDTTDTSALTSATPTNTALPTGLTVTGALGAEPTITFTGDTQPKTQELVIAKGSGPAITKTDQVVYQYVATYSKTLDYAYSTWKSGGAQVASAGVDELVGQTVGSRILLTTAPTGDSQSAQSGDPGINEATLMVVDVLGVLHAAS